MADELIKTYTEGDTDPIFRRDVSGVTGIASLTGFTVRLRMRRPDGIDIVKTITEADDPLNGHIDAPVADPPSFFFQFVAADLVAGNLQRTEIEYDDGSGGITTERNIFFNIGGALG